MKSERVSGVVLTYISQAIKLLTGLVYTPVMLRLLGQSEYGLYQLVYSFVSYLSLLSMGFGSSYMRFYAQYKAKDDEEGIKKLNGMYLVIFLTISFVCVICGIFMFKNARIIFGDKLTEDELAKARTLLVLMVINLALTFITSVFSGPITAHEKFTFQRIVLIVHNILNPFLVLPLLLMGYGSVGMVAVTTFLTFLALVVNVYYAINKLKIGFSLHGLKFALFRDMFIFTFFIFLNNIIDQINWSVDKYLLGRMIGTTAVAIYGVGGQINSMYMEFSLAISGVFVPKINRLVANNEKEDAISEIFTKVGRIQFIILSLVVSGFIFFGRPFIRIWAGNGYDQAYTVGLLLIIPVTVPLIQNLGIEIQRAKNMHKTRSLVYLGIAVANIGLSIFLIRILNVTGAALGTALAIIAGNIVFMNWYYDKRIGINIKYFWKQIFDLTPALIAPVLIGILSTVLLDYTSVWKLFVAIVIYTCVFCLSMWMFGMNNYEKSFALRFIDKVRRTKK